MPTFTLNGTPVELVPQDRGAFDWLAGQVYRRMHDGIPLPGMLTMIADAGVKVQNLPATDPRIQAALWTLWQMGIASSRIEGEGDGRQVKWEKGEHPDLDSRPAMEHFTEEGIREGRALAAGLVIVHGRRIRVNGVEMPVKVNNIDLIRAQTAELQKRHTDQNQHPSLLAAAYVAELLTQGADQSDLRLRAALELAAALEPAGEIGPLLQLWLGDSSPRPGWRRLALVGHEPDLGPLAARRIGAPAGAVTLKKAGVALVALPQDGRPARLKLLLSPRSLLAGR
jgi:phosphohistidine phosphatase